MATQRDFPERTPFPGTTASKTGLKRCVHFTGKNGTGHAVLLLTHLSSRFVRPQNEGFLEERILELDLTGEIGPGEH